MGNTIVTEVVENLTAAGIRADEGYPGSRIPALTGPVAAVQLGKVDRSVRTTAVTVVVMSPATSGGGLCEKTALEAVERLQKMSATCVKDICRFDEMADVFYIEIQAVFFGTALPDDWLAGPGYSISLGQQLLPNVMSFSYGRSVKEGIALDTASWQFSLEELLPPGSGEPPDPVEPFVLTVTRESGAESFSGCKWLSVSREETIRGVRQIRAGTAATRNVAGIL